MPSNRQPIFTTAGAAFVLTAGSAAEGSQKSVNLSTTLETRLGTTARNTTAMRVWINGLWTTDQIVTSAVAAEYTIGIGVFTENIDNVDFPDLGTHAGDYMLHDARRLIDQNAATGLTLLDPPQVGGSIVELTTRSKRKLARTTDKLFMVVQKDRATEEAVTLTCSITVMWLLP